LQFAIQISKFCFTRLGNVSFKTIHSEPLRLTGGKQSRTITSVYHKICHKDYTHCILIYDMSDYQPFLTRLYRGSFQKSCPCRSLFVSCTGFPADSPVRHP
jgi:hypothetical protein